MVGIMTERESIGLRREGEKKGKKGEREREREKQTEK